MLTIRSLSRRFGDVVALDDAAVEVRPGRIVGFLQEIDANALAAALLIPEGLASEKLKRQLRAGLEPTSDQRVASLAARFSGSPEAMGYRLANLGISLQI